jgi:DNA primase catalytic core
MSTSPNSAPERHRSIPDSVIASVKKNVSILTMLRRYGVRVNKVGSGYKAICPFHFVDGHSERTASLSVNVAKNMFHCFSCDAGGDVIKLVERIEKLDFVRAVERLLALTPVPMSSKPDAEEKSAAKDAALSSLKGEKQPAESAKPALTEEQRQTILREVVRRSVDDLRNSEAGRKYLEARGLDPLSLLQSYTFGFCNGRAYDKLDSSGKEKLQALGLLNGGHAFFENCVIFPLSKDGRLTTIYARKTVTTPAENNGGGRHYLLPGKREGLFLPSAGLNSQKPVIITESIIDGLSLFAAGICNVLPLLGVNGFLADHLAYLKRQSFAKIFIALNGDEAGNRAAAKLKQNLADEKLPAEILTLPDGKDINDMLQELGAGKLHEWFSERIGVKDEGKPTVWEDDTGNLFVLLDDREYRVRGLSNGGMDRLKVNLKVAIVNNKQLGYYDTLDLYLSRSREHFILQSAKALQKERDEIAIDINRLITTLEELRLQKKEQEDKPRVYQMSEEERTEALAYLKSPDLLDRIAADFEACGMVGNRNNCLLAFLVSLSRMLEKSLGALTISRSAAGKNHLQDMVAMFVPEEWRWPISKLTGQMLFYRKGGIKNRVMVIEEDEGMKDAMFAIRVLLSSQKLRLQGIKHDQQTGELRDYENVVEGPASVMIATTDKAAFDHETANRFFSLYLDESPEQTKKILEFQDKLDSIEGLEIRARHKIIAKLQQNVQRLLKPIMVVNPIGTGIKYPLEILHCRREKTKIQTLIKTVALLYQYQRPIKEKEVFGAIVKYIEVTQQDVDMVKRIAADILRDSLDDLSRLCRILLGHIHDIVDEKYAAATNGNENEPIQRWQIEFTRKELMDRSQWSLWHIKEHVKELEERGYICPKVGKKGQRYSYCLVDETLPELPDIG